MGRLTSLTDAWVYTWNAENLLTKETEGPVYGDAASQMAATIARAARAPEGNGEPEQ